MLPFKRLLLIFLFLSPAIAQVSKAPQIVTSSQIVSLLFAGATDSDKVLLTLNNNRPSSLTVNATVLTLSGERVN